MNRPKITKQTLKALRGELLAKQNAQKYIDENEKSENVPPKTVQESRIDYGITQENEGKAK